MDTHNLIESLFRWIHVVAGILWIGLLYFFNFVNANFAPTMDGETKKKVVPQLMPRALFFFRWGAAYTWVSGVLLLFLLYYHGAYLFDSGQSFGIGGWISVAITFLGVHVYDLVMKSIKDPKQQAAVGFVLASAAAIVFEKVGQFSYRGTTIHLGSMLGTIMAFNVWFRIWPSQKKIITAVRDGQKPEDGWVSLAGTRSKHNTYMSVPLVFAMMSQHATWASGKIWALPMVILLSWIVTFAIFNKAKTVQGF